MNTTLHIAPEHTTLTLPDGSRHTLAIGSATLLRHNPPSEYEWERAIMTVEDAISPLQTLINPQSTLYLAQPELAVLADAQGLLSRETVEQTFQHISRYPTPDTLPDTARIQSPAADCARMAAPYGLYPSLIAYRVMPIQKIT
jgi:hypothetical protein